MKFGKVENVSEIDYTLPKDAPKTQLILGNSPSSNLEIYVGCAKWNKTDLKDFYPKGTKDELTYYSRQFNSIELNATHYSMPTTKQVVTWREKTPDGFKFFPKITNSISHFKRLLNVQSLVDMYCDAVASFEEKLGMVFLQLHDNFSPREFDKLKEFIAHFPKVIPLAVEVRNEAWFLDKNVWEEYCTLLENNHVANLIVDTPGRRDMVHMRLTTPVAFVRFVGCNDDEIDLRRIDEWVDRAEKWQKEGLQKLYFFVHQNIELSSPLFSAYFIEKLNKRLNLNLQIPKMANGQSGLS